MAVVPSTLVIVDDHAAFRRRARQLLERDGYDVVGEAEDGASALRCVADLRPGVILLDIGLPDISGFEVTRRIAAMPGPAPAVVLTSTHDAADFATLVSDCGARGFVAKADLSGAALRRLSG